MKPSIAVIGAGIAGLTLARALAEHADVTVFEKARGPGGRMSVRRGERHTFDHGAQYFTARDPAFATFLIPLMHHGVVARWEGQTVFLEASSGRVNSRPQPSPYYVGVPGMNALCKWLAEGVHLVSGTETAPVTETTPSGKHALRDASGQPLGECDWVISTAPPAQTCRLFEAAIAHDHPIRSASMHCCYALMIGFDEQPPAAEWMAAEVTGDDAVQWISAEHRKPGRTQQHAAYTVHARHDWSDAHADADQQDVQAMLEARYHALTGRDPALAAYRSLHRWRYAARDEPAGAPRRQEPLWLPEHRLAACGDWQGPSRVENAALRAMQLAELIKTAVKG